MFDNNDLLKETDKLKGFAYRLTGNQADAEDLLQSTILKAIEKKELFEKGTNLFGWTSKIMYNMFVSGYRRKVKFELQGDPDDYLKNQSVKAVQEKEIEMKEIDQAMQSLSDQHREILIMVCVKGMQYADVSEALQIPVGTVRSRLSRARETLQQKLETPVSVLAQSAMNEQTTRSIAA